MSSATKAPWKILSSLKVHCRRLRRWHTFRKFWMLLRSSLLSILCIEISSHQIFWLAMALSNWQISASVKVYKAIAISHKLCLDRPSIWLLKFSKARSTQSRQIFGLLELYSIKCCTDSAPLKRDRSLGLSTSWTTSKFPSTNKSTTSPKT